MRKRASLRTIAREGDLLGAGIVRRLGVGSVTREGDLRTNVQEAYLLELLEANGDRNNLSFVGLERIDLDGIFAAGDGDSED